MLNTIIFYLSMVLIFLTIIRITITEITYKNIPKVLRIIHYIMYMVCFVMIVYSGCIELSTRESEIFLCISFLVNLLLFLICISFSIRMNDINDIYNERKKIPVFQSITAKNVAEKMGIEYISNAEGELINDQKNERCLVENKYMLLTPLNNGKKIFKSEWYGTFKEDFTVQYVEKVLTNENGFKGINNLDEILLEMVRLFKNTIDKDVFFNCYGFAIKLEDEVNPQEYEGNASLVITDAAVINARVNDKREEKMQCLNNFIDKYISWNFGEQIRKNAELKASLEELNQELIDRGLRKPKPINRNNTFNKDVQPFYFKDKEDEAGFIET